MNSPQTSSSPPWPHSLKLVVGLTVMGAVLILIIYFRGIIGPLLLAFITSYLLHPLAAALNRHTRLSWRAAANLIFLVLVILLLGLSTATGVVAVQQIQSLIRVIERFLNDLPNITQNLSQTVYSIGPFQFDLGQYLDLSTLGDQLIRVIQPILGRAGTLVSSFATSAASTIGWLLFSLLVAYFILVDAGRVPDAIQFINIPGYDTDIRTLAYKLGITWNAYLRGQLIIVGIVIVTYAILLTILDVRYAMGIAIIVGMARFVPYVGPIAMYGVTFLVTVFQSSNYFRLEPLQYALLVIAVSFIVDQIFDNLISPRILGQSLGVHPAAVLVAAIIAANLIGIIGLVLAAPVLASIRLVGQYVMRKMLDLEPWPVEDEMAEPPKESYYSRVLARLQTWWRSRKRR